ncbi:membrane protein [Staphylococcus microti]|uniref:Membrane protein n=1 Tax=Staphylococcus microti TaxID=569857 RepID=A0A0D6XRS0_9STAP|nr:hypothetical protein [Staphylococcus microti]KIX91150.1 membrane protein [Staphylococcus microti]PNZ75735.1 hypothetical protein CD132_11850 [Staphylococcus microti]SUM58242.1 Uncharacterised protein [Staphylococcus microti]
MTTFGIILIVLLLISVIPNFYMLYKSKKEGIENPRAKLMVGIDALLVVLIVAAVFFLNR